MELTDSALWESWQREKDANAFSELLARHSGMVYGTCRRILANKADAEDAAQECFVQLMKAKIHVTDSLAPWLHTVATRRSLDLAKSRGRRAVRDTSYADSLTDTDDITDIELMALVDEVVEQLPDEHRGLIVARFFENRKLIDIAEEMGLAESTVRLRLTKAVEVLRSQLRTHGVTALSATITAVLGSKLIESAPASVILNINKLALAGAGTKTAVAATATTTGMSALAKVCLGAAIGGSFVIGLVMMRPPVKIEKNVAVIETAEENPSVSGGGFIRRSRDDSPDRKIEDNDILQLATNAPANAEDIIKKTEGDGTTLKIVHVSADTRSNYSAGDYQDVRGTVTDQNGEPIAQAKVDLIARTGIEGQRVYQQGDIHKIVEPRIMYHSGYSNRDGKFDIRRIGFMTADGIPTGEVILSVTAPGYQTSTQRITVTKSQEPKDLEVRLKPGINVYGTVNVTQKGKGSAGVVECVWFDGERMKDMVVVANYSGGFIMGFEGEGNGTFVVHSLQNGQAVFPQRGIFPGANFEFSFGAPARLIAVITDPYGEPMAGASVELDVRYPRSFSTPQYAANPKVSLKDEEIGTAITHESISGEFGLIQFPMLNAGPDFVVRVNGQESTPGQTISALAESIGPLSAGEERQWTGVVQPAADAMEITGKLTGIHGTDIIPDGRIMIEHVESGTEEFITVYPGGARGQDGTFTLKLPEQGTYVLWPAYDHGDLPHFKKKYGVRLTMRPGGSQFIGFRIPSLFSYGWMIVDENHMPVSGATIEVVADDTIMPHRNTNGTFGYSWRGNFIPNEITYFAEISKNGYATVRTRPFVGSPYEEQDLELVVLHETGSFQGIFVDHNGEPLRNMEMTAQLKSDEFLTYRKGKASNTAQATTRTNEEGAFIFRNSLPAVEGILTVYWEPQEGRTVAADLEVELVPQMSLDVGVVVDPSRASNSVHVGESGIRIRQ